MTHLWLADLAHQPHAIVWEMAGATNNWAGIVLPGHVHEHHQTSSCWDDGWCSDDEIYRIRSTDQMQLNKNVSSSYAN